MRRSRGLALAGTMALVMALVAGCSSSTKSGSPTPPTTTSPAATAATIASTLPATTTTTTRPATTTTELPPATGCELTTPDAAAAPGVTVESLLQRGRVNIAHDGGDLEGPGDVLFAYREALANGADVLDMNLLLSSDGQLVLGHDATVDAMTDATGNVSGYTAAQLNAMDAAYWWVPGAGSPHDRPAADYPCRGVRTGEKATPAGATAADFGIPTFQQVVDAFPDAVFGVELEDEAGEAIVPALVNAIKANHLEQRIAVSSMSDTFMAAFTAALPGVAASPGPLTLLAWRSTPGPLPGYRIAQIPPKYGDIVVTQQDFDNLNRSGLPIWVWPNDAELENQASYEQFIAMGANGVNTDRPSVMAKVESGR